MKNEALTKANFLCNIRFLSCWVSMYKNNRNAERWPAFFLVIKFFSCAIFHVDHKILREKGSSTELVFRIVCIIKWFRRNVENLRAFPQCWHSEGFSVYSYLRLKGGSLHECFPQYSHSQGFSQVFIFPCDRRWSHCPKAFPTVHVHRVSFQYVHLHVHTKLVYSSRVSHSAHTHKVFFSSMCFGMCMESGIMR